MELQEKITTGQKLAAAVAQGGWILGLGPVFVPLLIWLVSRKDHPFVAHHAKQSLLWQVVMFVFCAIAMLALIVIVQDATIVALVLIVLMLPCAICSIYAVVKALTGEEYHYPLLGRF